MSEKFKIINQLNTSQIQDLHQLYQGTWWGKERILDDIKIMLKHSDIIIGLCHPETEKLIGFTRVLTDYIYRATIFDVIIDTNHQKQGLGSLLIQTVLNHQKLQKIEVFQLFCLPEVIPFYEKCGFTRSQGSVELMFRSQNKI